jgi:endoglucanase
MRVAAASLAALLIAGPCRAAEAFVPISAADQAAQMHRGMNILDDDPYFEHPERARFKLVHLARLRAAGFDTVRLNLHVFAHLYAGDGLIDRSYRERLVALADAALADGLTVILDVHDGNLCDADIKDCDSRLTAAWAQFSAMFAAHPNRLLFEILNEPHGRMTTALWNATLRDALRAIRAANPMRNVIVGPAEMSGVDQLPRLDLPVADRHIIATVHYYTPVRFTLQGAPWIDDLKNVSGVTWGSDADLAQLVKSFDGVKAWSEASGRPMFLGEFGVYYEVPMAGRARWIAAVARVAEAHGFPWAYWQLDTDFAAYDIARDTWVEPVRKALVPNEAP